MSSRIFLPIFVFFALLLFLAGCIENKPINPSQLQPGLAISNQFLRNCFLLVDSATLDKPGFVVLFPVNSDGTSGSPAGVSTLLTGSHFNIPIQPDCAKISAIEWMAQLYYDNGDGRFSSTTEEIPVTFENRLVAQKFKIAVETVSKSQSAANKTVEMTHSSFVPSDLRIFVGNTVRFENQDSIEHMVTIASLGIHQTIPPGEFKDIAFNEPGSFPFFCSIHPSMRGTITVETFAPDQAT